MAIRVRRMFPERPLTRRDFRDNTLHVSFDWDGPVRPGVIRFTDRPNELIPRDLQDFLASIHVADDGENLVGCMFVLSDARMLHIASSRAEGEALYALVRHAIAEAGERPLVGYSTADEDNLSVLHSLGLTVLSPQSPAGQGKACLFYTFLPSEVEAALQRHDRS